MKKFNSLNLLSTRFHVSNTGELVYNGLETCLMAKTGEKAILLHPYNLVEVKYKNQSGKILFALEDLKYKF